MGLWEKLGSLFKRTRTVSEDADAILFYVSCEVCGEIIRVRADRRWDLVEDFDGAETAYTLHKDVLGARCNRLMSIHVSLDRNHTILGAEARGGSLVTAEEYEAARPDRSEREGGARGNRPAGS